MTADVLRSIADALDAARANNDDAAAAQALFKSAAKKEKETWAPLKALLSQKYGVPTSTELLQTCVEAGAALGEFATALLQQSPRELWRSDGDAVALKRPGTADVFRGARAALPGKKSNTYDVYDLATLTVVYSVPVAVRPLAARFKDADTLRVLQGDGQLVEHSAGEKKGRVVAAVDVVIGDGVAFVGGAIDSSGDHFAVVVERADADGNIAYSVVVDGGAAVALDVASVSGVFFVGGVVSVCVINADGRGGVASVNDARASVIWLPRYPSGGSAPDRAEHAHHVVSVFGATWLITWGESAPTSRRWLRLPDLVEDDRFGHEFDDVVLAGDAVWSGHGDRVTKDGPRTSPIAWPGRCFACFPVDDACVVAVVCDSKDKLWLRRFRRL